MGKVRVGAFSVSVDGFGAGSEQSLDDPLGKNGREVHGWFFPTRFFQTMIGKGDGETGIDNDFGERAMTDGLPFGLRLRGGNDGGHVALRPTLACRLDEGLVAVAQPEQMPRLPRRAQQHAQPVPVP